MSVSVHLFAFNSAIAAELKERIKNLTVESTSSFRPSAYQADIFSFIAKERGSAIVRAVPGSGKTTTCIQSLRHIPGVDLANVRASTFHSVGFSAILRHLNLTFSQLTPDRNKVRDLLRRGLDEETNELYGAFVAKLIGLAKGEGFGAIRAASVNDWHDLIAHHDLFLDSEEASEERAVELAREYLRVSNTVAKTERLIDFDDQLYLPLLWKCRLWQNDYVYVDEAQDTNPVRRAIVKLALRPGGRLIAVGDENQGIYGFTGASDDAMDLIEKEFSCRRLPLTVSYRCAQAIVRNAQTLYPDIEASPSAPEGEVVYTSIQEALKVLQPSDAILCRNTAPLVDLAFKLIAKGVGCHILGKEIGAGLVNLIKKQKARGIENLEAKLSRYAEREIVKFMAKGQEEKAESVSDRMACISTVINSLNENERTIPGLIGKLEGMFSDSNGVLTLSTMHKSKGREWDRVAIYKPELCPSKFARQAHQQRQEKNLQWVAWTRPKLWLGFVDGEV